MEEEVGNHTSCSAQQLPQGVKRESSGGYQNPLADSTHIKGVKLEITTLRFLGKQG